MEPRIIVYARARRMQRKRRTGTALFVLLRCRCSMAVQWPRRGLPLEEIPPLPDTIAAGVTCHNFTLRSAAIARPEGIGNPAAELFAPVLAFVRRNTEQAPRAFRTAIGYEREKIKQVAVVGSRSARPCGCHLLRRRILKSFQVGQRIPREPLRACLVRWEDERESGNPFFIRERSLIAQGHRKELRNECRNRAVKRYGQLNIRPLHLLPLRSITYSEGRNRLCAGYRGVCRCQLPSVR